MALPDKWQSLSSAVGAPKRQRNPSWCLGANCPSCLSPLVKKQGQVSVAWATDPAQHPRRKAMGAEGLPCSSQEPVLVPWSPVMAPTLTSQRWEDSRLLSHRPPSPCSTAGAGTDQTLPLMVPTSIPSGLGCRLLRGSGTPGERLTALTLFTAPAGVRGGWGMPDLDFRRHL